MKRKYLLTALAVVVGFSGVVNGQVFTQADGAVEGPTSQGEGQALYGTFGEYSVYRKMTQRETEEPLSSAMNVDGNPGEAEWINVNQRQAGSLAGQPNHVLTAPGMFIGSQTHTTEDGWTVSNPDQILYFKPLIDNSGDANTEDSNRNVRWDTRFGFMENPDDYLDAIEPNSGQLDLWTGDFQTDAVYLQNFMLRDDSTVEEGQTLQQTGHGGSFKLHSAVSNFGDERERRNYEITRTTAGTGEELERNGLTDAGVAYEDPLEVTWGLRLNDPENEDEILGREVEFFVKVGNVISSGVFDPDGGEDGVFPDLTVNDDNNDFEGRLFDWENAVPVFFAGAQGLAQGTGSMGIFTPGDFGADGSVGLEDFERLVANWGGEGTTYSRGDITQDGFTNLDDATAWAEVADDSTKSAVAEAIAGDMIDFGGADAADVMAITELFPAGCQPGNGDLDGNNRVEFADFLILSNNFGQEADAAGGDINCDGTVGFPDFLIMSDAFGTDVGAASVPEPNSIALLFLGLVASSFARKRRS